MAETYRIYDYRSLPLSYISILASGLGLSSRIVRKMSGVDYTTSEITLAMIADSLNTLVWFKTEDGHKNRNRPKSILSQMIGQDEKKEKEYITFESGEAFEKWWNEE